MRRICIILLSLLPIFLQAQIQAPGVNYKQPTTGLVAGQTDTVHVFYDQSAMLLKATQKNGHRANFTWKKLNTETHTLDFFQQDNNVLVSTLNNIPEGGYQVAVRDLVDLAAAIDTFTTWVFRDTFRIDSIRYAIDCDVLQLNMYTMPYIFPNYTIYNFKQALTPPYGGESIFNQVKSVEWTPVDKTGREIDIFPNVSDADQTWRTRKNWLTYIDNPPPLANAYYALEVIDVFGKTAGLTTSYEIIAIAAKAIAATEEEDTDGAWKDAGDAPEGEALYKVRFSHQKSVNAINYKWKGFPEKNVLNSTKIVVWSDSVTNADTYIYPRMPYKGQILNGYTPGAYEVRLIVNNKVCTDSVSIQYIVVAPSTFDAEAIPNAFTPNGDNQNDIFTFVKGREPVSMEYVNVYIYNRSGGLVYRYEGRSDQWEGWNGHMMGSGADAAEGVYFYVINGQGWDDISYNSKDYSGYLHLFR